MPTVGAKIPTMDHAHHAADTEPATPPAPFAGFGFGVSIAGLILVLTLKLMPLGFALALLGVVACVLGLALAVPTGRSPKTAVAGLVCAAVAILFWILAHDHYEGVLGGRDAWGPFA